jgi:UTP--glucose-1-phosphate uridylyltransferase
LAETEAREGLRRQLAELDPELLAGLREHGFRPEQLLEWAELIPLGADRNRVSGSVQPPAPGDVSRPPEADTDEGRELAGLGMRALAEGRLALAVLAGGMATRMGGVVKALVEALPGRTFLDLRLAERAHWASRSGGRLQLWVMSSAATDGPLRAALAGAGPDVHVFEQSASLRLTPDGDLFRDAEGRPSPHATGHGDLPDALVRSGLLERFVAGGGRYVWIANLDNLGAGVDPLLLGWHIQSGGPLTVEVAARGGDVGGIPVRWNGRPVVLEDFRLPAGFDREQVDVFNTNTLLADARALLDLRMPWTYFTVRKQVDGLPAVQFERLVGELTSGLDSRFIEVPRSGPGSRFLPVKDTAELEARRADIAVRVAPLFGQTPDTA